MAYRRKNYSLKNQEISRELQEVEQNCIFAGAYCRLSVENENETSIENQKRVILAYAEEHPELSITEFYIDDGVTGTMMDRPAWNRMMKDVAHGRIQCVLVKDLSRFGRNYIETGHYLENIFPKLGARLIAITDEFDTEELDDQLSIQLKNLVNDTYAKDISKKISFVFDRQRKNGTLKRRPCFGFTREDGKLVADPQKANVVKMMFKWAEMGVNLSEIADRLAILGILPPSKGGDMVDDGFVNWSSYTVRSILVNEAYIGDFVSGRELVHMHKKNRMSEEDWTVIRDHHEALVSREQFDAVQEKLSENHYAKRTDTYHPLLQGRLVCGVCGCHLILSHVEKDEYRRYICRNHTGNERRQKVQFERLSRMPSILESDLLTTVEERCEAFQGRYKYLRYKLGTANCIGGLLEKYEERVVEAKHANENAKKELEELYCESVSKEIDTLTYMGERERIVNLIRATDEALQNAMMEKNQRETEIVKARELYRADVAPTELIQEIRLLTNGTVRVKFQMEEEIARMIEA